MAWDFKPAIPIYLQVIEEITARIFDGRYPPGSKIPSVREIAEEAAVNPNTVQRSFSELENTGLIVTMRTAGRAVTTDKSIIDAAKNAFAQKATEEFAVSMRKRGISIDDLLIILEKLKEQNRKEEIV